MSEGNGERQRFDLTDPMQLFRAMQATVPELAQAASELQASLVKSIGDGQSVDEQLSALTAEERERRTRDELVLRALLFLLAIATNQMGTAVSQLQQRILTPGAIPFPRRS